MGEEVSIKSNNSISLGYKESVMLWLFVLSVT